MPPSDVSLVLRIHLFAGLADRLDAIVERDYMGAVAVQGEARRRDGFDGADRVALDAGDLDEEPLRRVAGHAEAMLERDLRGILHLLVPRPSWLRQKRKWA